MAIDFTKIDYLAHGSLVQQGAYRLLLRHKLFDRLAPFDPVLAGTFPLDLVVKGSDLDVLCCFDDAARFASEVVLRFGHEAGFSIQSTLIDAQQTVVANFSLESYPIEIFGQSVPVTDQQAFRHLLIEYALLVRHGESFKERVLQRKRKGIKTEPAFAELLGLEGDPYQALLDYQLP